MKTTIKSRSIAADLAGYPPVSKMLGNGERTVLPQRATLTVWEETDAWSLTVRGVLVLKKPRQGQHPSTSELIWWHTSRLPSEMGILVSTLRSELL